MKTKKKPDPLVPALNRKVVFTNHAIERAGERGVDDLKASALPLRWVAKRHKIDETFETMQRGSLYVVKNLANAIVVITVYPRKEVKRMAFWEPDYV